MNLYKFKRTLKPYNMAIISVFIAVLSMNIVSLISMTGKKAIARELDGVGMNGMSVSLYNAYKENITDITLYDALEKCSFVDTLTPVLYDYAQVNFNTGTQINSMCWGISPTAEKIVNLEKVHGRMFSDYDIENKEFVCLIDEDMAVAAYGRSNIIGKELYVTVSNGVYRFEIIGIVNKTSSVLNGMSGEIIPDFIYIPFTTMENIYLKQNLDQILINVSDDSTDEKSIETYLKENINFSGPVTMKITNLSEQRDSINKIVDIAFLALFAVSCVAIIVCSISVAASVNTAVTSAKHDIGIKISLGARKTDIMIEFLLYSLAACILGIISGTFIGLILIFFINLFFSYTVSYDLSLLMRGISATIFLTVIFSIYPSWQAASLVPVKALSRE